MIRIRPILVFLLFLASCILLPKTFAADRTVAVKMNEPLEIPMPSTDALSEWVVQEYPESLLEQVAIRRLPAETVFLFRPLAMGGGLIRFAKKASGVGSKMLTYDVEVMVTGNEMAPPVETPRKNTPAPSPAAARGKSPAGSAAQSNDVWSDPLFLRMLHGRLGFPAKNPLPTGPSDTEEMLRRKNTLPYSLTYVFPEGSYLLNPTHHLPLPDTPPGIDTAPPAYHQALALARRGLNLQASLVLDDMVKDMKSRQKTLPPAVLAFYEFVNAHIQMDMGNYPEAVRRFKELFPDKNFGRGSRFYAALATEKLGDTLGAISGYQGVISYNPEGYFTPEAAYRIARLFLKSNAYERAIQEYKDYILNYPHSPFIDDAILDLATVYDQIYEYQDFDVALKLYESILQDYSASPYKDTVVLRKKYVMENYF